MGASIPAFSCRAILLLLLKGGLRFRQTPRAARMCSAGGREITDAPLPQRTFLSRVIAPSSKSEQKTVSLVFSETRGKSGRRPP